MFNYIGFYGHSNCAYRSPYGFIDLIADRYHCDIVNQGVRQGSEERILYELKKTKKLDLAVIFHSEAKFLFLPDANRDIFINSFSEQKIDYLFKNFNKDNPPKFIELFKTKENFLAAYQIYKTYFYNNDVQLNRFYGSLIQIDQYVTRKNIPTIHIIRKEHIPNWFDFTSGVVDHNIMKIAQQYYDINKTNLMNEQGNRLVFERLTELVEELFPLSSGAVA